MENLNFDTPMTPERADGSYRASLSKIPLASGDPLTMSSREIAELTGKNHQHVLRDTEAMLKGLDLAPDWYVQFWTHPQNGQQYREFRLGKDLTLTLIAGYEVKLRKAIIDRWMELEAAIMSPVRVPQTMVEALRLAADAMERAELAERTKAEIGTRREATAMNTASQATKKAAKLEIELDRAKQYASIKRRPGQEKRLLPKLRNCSLYPRKNGTTGDFDRQSDDGASGLGNPAPSPSRRLGAGRHHQRLDRSQLMNDETDNQFPLIQKGVIDGQMIQMVDARDLHHFLQVGKVFGAWITERVDQFNFLENQDFVVFSEIGKNPQGGRPTKEYGLTLGMAKELAMVERNDQGKRVRQYFIECERRANTRILSTGVQLRDVSIAFRSFMSIGKAIGLDRNQAALAAARGTVKYIGVDPLRAIDVSHLLAPQQEPALTPSDIGVRLGGKSGIAVNQLLAERGLQTGLRDAKGRPYWEPTEEGKKYAVFLDTGKKHSDGTPVNFRGESSSMSRPKWDCRRLTSLMRTTAP
jgi:phage anti-repressor protein/phage regulator Rha-like protein